MNNRKNPYTSAIKQIESGKMSTSLAGISAALLLLFSPICVSEFIKQNNTPEKIKEKEYITMCQILKEKTEADPIAVISNFLAQYKEELNQQYAKDVLQNKDYSEEISQLREAKKDTLQCMRETFDELKMNRSLSIPTQVSNSTTERHQENDKEKICLRNDSIDTIQREIDAIVFMKRTQ